MTHKDDFLEPAVPNTRPLDDGDRADMYIFGQPFDNQEEWLAGIPEETRQGLDESRAVIFERARRMDELTEVLKHSAPELLSGRLPADLQSRFEAVFNYDDQTPVVYAMGVNQSAGAQTLEEATAVLDTYGGIEMFDYGTSFESRFRIFDEDSAEQLSMPYLGGHYGPHIGRFIAVFPVVDRGPDTTPYFILNKYGPDALPADFTHTKPLRDGYIQDVVNTKYICGFIEAESGLFHANENFLVNNQVAFAE